MEDKVLIFPFKDGLKSGDLIVRPTDIRGVLVMESACVVGMFELYITIDGKEWRYIDNNLTKEFAYEKAKNLLLKGEWNYY